MVPSPAAERVPASAASQWVVFSCGDYCFGLPLDRTREILPPRPITRLPGCGPEVCGLVGIRGRIVTVFDFGVIIGGRSALEHADHRMLVLFVQGRRIAAVVDAIIAVSREATGVMPLIGDALRPYDIERDDLVGIGALDDRPFLALDPDRILGRLLM
ncbi:MAG: chemotaxis protein CheW [Gemmatimonadota bacterium]